MVWKVPTPGIINGGAMVTAGGVVFQGHVDGTFNAFDATTKKAVVLSSGRCCPGCANQLCGCRSPVCERPGGTDQRLGFGNAARLSRLRLALPRLPETRVITFALDGQAKLPPAPAPSRSSVTN